MDEKKPSGKTQSRKKGGSFGLFVLLVVPFLIFSIGVGLICVFFFREFVESSSLWRFVVNTNAVSTPENNTDEEILSNGEIIGGVLEDISIPTVEKPDVSEEASEEDVSVDEDVEEQIYYDKKDFPGYKWGELWARLSIPSIGLEDKKVYAGESNSIFKKGIGKRFGTRFTGQGGNIVLGAHVTREFDDLQLMKVGDRVYIETEYG